VVGGGGGGGGDDDDDDDDDDDVLLVYNVISPCYSNMFSTLKSKKKAQLDYVDFGRMQKNIFLVITAALQNGNYNWLSETAQNINVTFWRKS
jgi:hypothetical protein